MASTAMAVLAASVALGYFTIAAAVAPRIKMPSAGARVVFVIRCAAIAFFVGCGMTHVHILVHTLGYGTPMQVEAHELVFHSAQAIGAWLFIAGAVLRLELHVVPSQTRTELEEAVEEQRRLTEDAQNLARRDELTGLARRWRFDEELARQVARARRHDAPAALILLDLDGLKTINDTFGHQTGDSVLEHVAGAMRDELRGSDLAARIGGDEFAAILGDAGIDEAEAVAKRIVAAARRTGAELPGTSVSVGITPIAGWLTVSEVMKHADDALYDAKRAGGDRCARSVPRAAHAV
jgi:diguanylate cyclase (GGDEF)-like protein